MNLLIVSALDIYEPEKGLSGSPQTKTIDYFLNNGDSVTLITSNFLPSIKSSAIFCPDAKFYCYRFDYKKLKSIFKFRLFGWFARSLDWILFQLFAAGQIILLNPRSFDIFYAYEIQGVPILKLFSIFYNKPLVTRFQGTVVSKDFNLLNKIKSWQHFLALTIRSELTIITNDGTQGDQVLKRIRGDLINVQFLVNGIDKIFYEIPIKTYGEQLSCINLFCCGRLVIWKNHDRNIRVLSEIVKNGIDAQLYVIGDGPDKSKLILLAAELGVTNKVHFVGAIEHSKLVKFIERSDIYITNYQFSNFGKTMMEAMAGGKPIIATNVGDTNKFMTDGFNGYLLQDNDIEGMARSIINLASSAELMNQYSLNSRQLALKNFWSWNERFQYERNIILDLISETKK